MRILHDKKLLLAGVVGLGVVLVVLGCVSRTEYPTDLPPPDEAPRSTDTSYAVVNPIWTGAGGLDFKRPHGVTYGYDRSIYICDTDNDRVVRMSIAGEYIEEYSVDHPVQVTQDRQLNLICVDGEGTISRRNYFSGGEFDTVVFRDSLGVLTETQRLGTDSVFFDSLLIDSVWVDSVWMEIEVVIYDTIVVYVPSRIMGIAASPLPDRLYYVIDSTRSLVTLQDVTDRGVAPDLFRAFARSPARDPVGIMIYSTGEDSYNIVFSQSGWVDAFRIVRHDTFRDVVLDTIDIYELLPRGHKQVACDELGNFLIVCAKTHEVYKFTHNGAFTLKFGGLGAEPGQFNIPRGIAYGDKTLYIADTGNDRIVRYRLSTDIQY